MISGELVPVEKTEGGPVTGTTINDCPDQGRGPVPQRGPGIWNWRAPLDGIEPWAALIAALSNTQTGIDWSDQCKHHSP